MTNQIDCIYLNGILRNGKFNKIIKKSKLIDIHKVEFNMAVIKCNSVDDILINPEILIYYENKFYYSKLLRFYVIDNSLCEQIKFAELLMPDGKYDYKYDSYFTLSHHNINKIEVAFLLPEEIKDYNQANFFLVGNTLTYAQLESLNMNVAKELVCDITNFKKNNPIMRPNMYTYNMNTNEHLILNDNKEKYAVQEQKISFQI